MTYGQTPGWPNDPYPNSGGQPGGYQPGYGQQPGGYQPGYGQPGGYQPYQGEPPQNYLGWAIAVTIMGVLCCGLLGLGLGIASIVNANQVKSKWNMGDFHGAQEASERTKKWVIAGAVVDVIGFILVIIYAVVRANSGV
ncbi:MULTISPECIES: CD225/dispanin family protein [unclassified Nocardia]|uniref:CD225/dispanin family protein n=1 Tax=unclassified Nocardia TaxID=2637762 RepID=UPI001CE4140F|nr:MULTISPECIES: CD225/dispanin family protein [unclassified Nocardia]